MSERYTRLKDLTFPAQPADCPATLDKGALLLDNERARCILQLKFRNNGTTSVNSVQVAITCMDEAGQIVRTVKHAYTANAAAGAFFGSDQAIDLGGTDVQDVRVIVEQTQLAGGKTVKSGALFTLMRSVFMKVLIPATLLGLVLGWLQRGGNIGELLDLPLTILFYVGLGIAVAVFVAMKKNGTAECVHKKPPIALILLGVNTFSAVFGFVVNFASFVVKRQHRLECPMGAEQHTFNLTSVCGYCCVAS